MKTVRILLILAAFGAPATAAIDWTWENAGTGTEQGTFVTDGCMTDDVVPAGSYTILDAAVTATAYPLPLGSMSDGTYFNTQPTMGFDWDGSTVTVFWRFSGVYTNGINISVAAPAGTDPDNICMNIDYFQIDYDETTSFLYETQTPVITPVGEHVAAEESSFGRIKRLYR